MDALQRIKTAFERQTRAVSLRPGIGKGTAITKVTTNGGLACQVTCGSWQLTTDLNEKWGGEEAGPTPGTLGRAAFGGCLAMGYLLWAARLDVPISNVQVEVRANYDTRGICDLDDVPAVYTKITYLISLETTEPEETIIRLLDKAEAHSTYFQIFNRSMDLERILDIKSAEA